MLGVRINRVFASRWNALLWSAGILMTAYCSVPDPAGDSAPGQDQAAVAIPEIAPEPAQMD